MTQLLKFWFLVIARFLILSVLNGSNNDFPTKLYMIISIYIIIFCKNLLTNTINPTSQLVS